MRFGHWPLIILASEQASEQASKEGGGDGWGRADHRAGRGQGQGQGQGLPRPTYLEVVLGAGHVWNRPPVRERVQLRMEGGSGGGLATLRLDTL